MDENRNTNSVMMYPERSNKNPLIIEYVQDKA